MKVNGKKILGANTDYFVVPRPTGDIVFKLTAVLNYRDFEKYCPDPEPPLVSVPGEGTKKNYNDENYRKALSEHSTKKAHWTILQTIKDSPGLEFETISLEDSNTWALLDKEFEEAGFSQPEIQRLATACYQVNAIDQGKLEEARARFLASLLEPVKM
jgi:hypothetical protein